MPDDHPVIIAIGSIMRFREISEHFPEIVTYQPWGREESGRNVTSMKRALRHADGVIVVVSEDAAGIDMFELGIAIGLGKKVLVLRYGTLDSLELLTEVVIDIKRTPASELIAAIESFVKSTRIREKTALAKSLSGRKGGGSPIPVLRDNYPQNAPKVRLVGSQLESYVHKNFRDKGATSVANVRDAEGAEKYIPDMAVSFEGLPTMLSVVPVEVAGSMARLNEKIGILRSYIEARGIPVGILVVESKRVTRHELTETPGILVIPISDLEAMGPEEIKRVIINESRRTLRAGGGL